MNSVPGSGIAGKVELSIGCDPWRQLLRNVASRTNDLASYGLPLASGSENVRLTSVCARANVVLRSGPEQILTEVLNGRSNFTGYRVYQGFASPQAGRLTPRDSPKHDGGNDHP
jgi:hypothetical protein